MLEVTSKQMSISHISPKLRNSKSYVQKTSAAKELFDSKQDFSSSPTKNSYSFKSKMMKPYNIFFKNIQSFKTQQMESIASSSTQFGLQVNSVTTSQNSSLIIPQEYISKSPFPNKLSGEVKKKHPYLQFYSPSRKAKLAPLVNNDLEVKDQSEKKMTASSKTLLPKNIFLEISSPNESIIEKPNSKRVALSEKRTLSLSSSKLNLLSNNNSRIILPTLNKPVEKNSDNKLDLLVVEPLVIKQKQFE